MSPGFPVSGRQLARVVAGMLVAAATISASVAQAGILNVANPDNFLANPSNSPSGPQVNVATPGISGFGPFTGSPQTIVDNLAPDREADDDFIFGSTGNNILSVSNFGSKSGAVDLRYFYAQEDQQRVPTAVAVYSSTANQTSTNPNDYTLLQTFTANNTAGPVWNYQPYDPAEDTTGAHRGYFDMNVVLPTGTQSLLLDLNPYTNGVRIYELQALQSPVPEPASLTLLGLGGLGLFLARRRRLA